MTGLFPFHQLPLLHDENHDLNNISCFLIDVGMKIILKHQKLNKISFSKSYFFLGIKL